MTQFLPLGGLKAAVQGAKKDLEQVRSLRVEQDVKVAKLDKGVFNERYVNDELAKIRADYKRQAENYLAKEDTFTRLDLIAAQEPYWTLGAFLRRVHLTPMRPPMSRGQTDALRGRVAVRETKSETS